MQSKGLSRVFSNTTVQKHPFFSAQLPSQSNSEKNWPKRSSDRQLHPYMTTGKTIAFDLTDCWESNVSAF